jgi:hypothetical protein
VLSRHIPDDRDRTRITHSYSDMTRARMFAIASGHEDCDDLDVLRSDPALKMACGRLPVSGTDLMSQPTLSPSRWPDPWRREDNWGPITAAVMFFVILAGLIIYGSGAHL